MQQKGPSHILAVLIIYIVILALAIWHFGPWRTKMTLADGITPDGARYRIVQNFKDFAATGWVIGVYLKNEDDQWQLRWSKRTESRWKNASAKSNAGHITITASTESETFTVTHDQLFTEIPEDDGWTLPHNTTASEMQTELLRTFY